MYTQENAENIFQILLINTRKIFKSNKDKNSNFQLIRDLRKTELPKN